MKTFKIRRLACALLVSLALGACSSAPKRNASLEEARVAYTEASEDVTVVKHAPEELDQARDALSLADKHWRSKESKNDVEHYSYIVSQRVQTAKFIAESNETDRQLEAMSLERRNVALGLREAELIKSKQQAQKLQREIAEIAEKSDRSEAELEAELAYAKREAEELKRQMDDMAALQAEKTDRGMVLTLGDVLFDVNEATLAPGATRNIEQIASFMQRYPEREAVIEGHTDSMGEDDYNLKLSHNRASSVRKALVSQGVNASRISTQGFGESLPVADNNSSTGRQKNRRVEIIFPDVQTTVGEYVE